MVGVVVQLAPCRTSGARVLLTPASLSLCLDRAAGVARIARAVLPLFLFLPWLPFSFLDHKNLGTSIRGPSEAAPYPVLVVLLAFSSQEAPLVRKTFVKLRTRRTGGFSKERRNLGASLNPISTFPSLHRNLSFLQGESVKRARVAAPGDLLCPRRGV